MARLGLFLPVLLVAPVAGADTTVTVRPTGVTIVATATPVSEVLDRLARQTGMKVVYEGSVPRTLVTTRIERRTPAEAVLAVLEGLGLGYALRLDPTGNRVESLLMMAASSGPTTSRPAAPVPAPLPMNPEPPVMPDDVAFEEMIEPDEGPQPPIPTEAPQKPDFPPQAPPPGMTYSPFAPPTPPPLTNQPGQPSQEPTKKPE